MSLESSSEKLSIKALGRNPWSTNLMIFCMMIIMDLFDHILFELIDYLMAHVAFYKSVFNSN